MLTLYNLLLWLIQDCANSEISPDGYISKKPLGRHRCKWEDNIKMALREIGWDGMDWINLARDRGHFQAHVNVAMDL
jgi:hypothetical protein